MYPIPIKVSVATSDVGRRGGVPTEEIGWGGVSGNPELRVARQPKPQLFQAVEPAFLQPAVGALAQRGQAFGP